MVLCVSSPETFRIPEDLGVMGSFPSGTYLLPIDMNSMKYVQKNTIGQVQATSRFLITLSFEKLSVYEWEQTCE